MRPGIFDQLQQRGDVILRKLERLADDADKFLSDDVRDQLLATTESLQGRRGRHRDAGEPGRTGDGASARDAQSTGQARWLRPMC